MLTLLLCFTMLGLAALPLCPAQLQVVNTFRGSGINNNNLELECRDQDQNEVVVSNAMFWLNELSPDHELRELRDPRVAISGNSADGRITFSITRELEGTYYCGRSLIDVSSKGLELVAYPDPTILPSNEHIFFAKAGTTARLDCSILPGALRRQYFADWINATSMTEVARVAGPRTLPSSLQPAPRFTVNEETFSLNIHSVRLTDAGSYRCVLGVEDPAGQQFLYPQTMNLILTLIVYSSPLIIRQPQDSVIALRNSQSSQSATFECQARGEPAPEVEWFHNSANVKDSVVPKKYTSEFISRRTGTGDFFVTSVLTIADLTPSDGGVVNCLVKADDNDLPNELLSTSASATLAVIGGVDSLDLLITTNGDIIFKLQLPSAILVPIQLYIRYVDAQDPDVTQQKITSALYTNTSQIVHFEPSAFVPATLTDNRVRIKIALRHQNHQGPINTSALEYDLQAPNYFTIKEASVQNTEIISITTSICVVVFLLAILISVLVSIVSWQQRRRRKMEFEKQLSGQQSDNQVQLDTQRESHTHELQRLKEENKTFLYEQKENNQAELERQKVAFEQELRSLREGNEHKERLKLLEVIHDTCKQRNCKRITAKLGSTVMTVQLDTEEDSTGETLDGTGPVDHTNLAARTQRRMETVNYNSVTGSCSEEAEECVVDCMRSIVMAGISDSKLGPELMKLIPSKQLYNSI